MSDMHEKPTTMSVPEPELSVAGQNDKEIANRIPHDCDNLLMIILEHAALLARGNLSQETQAVYIGRIESAAKQIRDQACPAHSPITLA